jgi:hypothetical protein
MAKMYISCLLQHIDYLGLGKQLGAKPIHIHYGRNDTLVDPACPTYMFDKLKEGGATNVLLLPSESVEGHYYVFTQVWMQDSGFQKYGLLC